MFSERSLDRAAVHTEEAVSANLLGVGKLPALEADQPVKLVGDFRQSHINVAHALFMQAHALRLLDQSLLMQAHALFLFAESLLVLGQMPGLHLLHFGLLPLYVSHDRHGVLELGYRLFEVHLNLV